MNKVPDMISTKDLSYISDMLEWFITMCKKAEHFSQEVENTQIKNAILSVYDLHKKHSQVLLGILNKGGSNE